MKQTTTLADSPVNVRLVLTGLWVAMLFVFAYVDIFGLMRKDVIEGVLDERVATAGLPINQTFLAGATMYILIPCLVIVVNVVASARFARWTNVILGVLYAVSIVVNIIGETWIYYLLGSVVEIVLLLMIAWKAWTWPTRVTAQATSDVA